MPLVADAMQYRCSATSICTRMYYMRTTDARSFQVPLTFRPGNRYRVTVRGLRQRPTSSAMTSDAGAAADTTTFDVLFKGSTEFRTGEGQCKKS